MSNKTTFYTVDKTEHWSKLKMKLVLSQKMNSIDRSGLKRKEVDYEHVRTFQKLLTNELAESFPGTEAVQVYAVGPRIAN